MTGLRTLLRYWHTLRHLKMAQFTGRAWFRLARPRPDRRPAPRVRAVSSGWVVGARRRVSLVGPETFRFLEEQHALAEVGWDGPDITKLWRYNQHYFEDLHGAGAESRAGWHRDLMVRWVADNPPARGTGWEPYPTSMRVVNWIKWAWQGNTLPDEAAQSLAVQARWIMKRLEWHLLGNHLFVNAKALVFAGLFFEGAEADAWRATGLRILRRQVPEQILADGGQFERSPMYHALALEDMLDLWNGMQACRGLISAADAAWIDGQEGRIGSMRAWLDVMTHPDGEIALFNDAAIGIAPPPAELDGYARRLGFPALPPLTDGMTRLVDSGYLRMQQGSMVAILDVGPIGPDYLPGHAHADTLSFELSLFGRRVLVDSGTSCYGTGPERLRQRGTAAHNTVTVDGEDSSEVWSGFRVARRARVLDLRIGPETDGSAGRGLRVECAHDGFRRLHPKAIHRRVWRFHQGSLEVQDRVDGPGAVTCHWHWAPGIEISAINPNTVHLDRHHEVTIDAVGTAWSVERSTWHPGFGRSEPCWKAVTVPASGVATLRFTWSERAPSLPD